MSEIMVETKDLRKYFNTKSGMLHAVDRVNMRISKGETMGVVGESGCGKSTLGRVMVRLLEPTSGQIMFNGKDIVKFSKRQMHGMRSKLQMIFQDPYSSLNPRMSIAEIIAEPIKVTKILTRKKEINDRVNELIEIVGLERRFINVYPHEIDGGRRQRVGIARALAVNPEFIVCDEPVSALDVSIQAQILNLLMDLQDDFKLTYMFITHDLSVVKHISKHVTVMYLGQCVELAKTEQLFNNPMHPYTQALLASIPKPNIDNLRELEAISGELSSPIEPKPGCRFAPRCPYVKDSCQQQDIPLLEVEPDHFVACTL